MGGRRQASVVYVIGASKGIGRACAHAFAERGAKLALFSRGAMALNETCADLKNAGAEVFSVPVDAADAQALCEAVAAAVAALGPPDVVINCVGGARPARFEDIDNARFEETLRWNLSTAWNLARAVVPAMETGGGVLVNTASLAGLIGVYGYTDYCAAKFGVIGFSEALRAELRPRGIDVRVLCPPDTETPGFAEEERTKPPETRAVSRGVKRLSSEAVAAELLRGLARSSFLIIPGRAARLASRLRRFAPRLVEFFMDRAVARESGQRGLARKGDGR
ncbi:MAG: SDR family NAD(P)-dependent oxidoreductase [Myxococcota bacterium]|jgi:short-subunit dehydrogenase